MIGWYVHDHGSGHRRRLEAVARHLRVPVTGMGSGPPAAGVEWLPLPTDATGRSGPGDAPGQPGEPGAGAVDPTAGGALHWAPLGEPGLLGRAAVLTRWVQESGCRLLVVDVSVEMLLLARLLGVATVAVLQPGRRDDDAHRLGYRTATALLAPWPREAGAAGVPVEVAGRTTWTGAFSAADTRTGPAGAPGCRHGGRCVALVLGAGGHTVRRADVRAAAGATPGWCWHVAGRLAGAPLADTDRPAGTVVEHGTLGDVRGLLEHADVVVGPSGGGLVAEVAAASRPFVALPQPRPFGEQRELARMLERLGCAEVAWTWPSPARWSAVLERALGTSVAPGRWDRWSDGRGAQRAADLVERTYAVAASPGAVPGAGPGTAVPAVLGGVPAVRPGAATSAVVHDVLADHGDAV